jgi:hypothetical protein
VVETLHVSFDSGVLVEELLVGLEVHNVLQCMGHGCRTIPHDSVLLSLRVSSVLCYMYVCVCVRVPVCECSVLLPQSTYHRVKTDERYEQTYVRLCELIAHQILVLG